MTDFTPTRPAPRDGLWLQLLIGFVVYHRFGIGAVVLTLFATIYILPHVAGFLIVAIPVALAKLHRKVTR